MKNFWKALGIAALAAVIPVQISKDEETGTRSYRSLLLELESVRKDEDHQEINIKLMHGLLTAPIYDLLAAKKETALFADDEPEAAVIPEVIDFAQAAAEARAAELQEAAELPDEAGETAEEEADSYFDPEF